MHRVAPAIVLVLTVILFGTGCSPDPDSELKPAETAAPPATAPEPTEASRPALPSRWQERLLADEEAPVEVDPPSIDLGSVEPHQQFAIEATLRNTGEEVLRIASSRADCGCTAVDMAGLEILPGEAIDLEAMFESRSGSRERTATIFVVFEGYSEPLRIPVRAWVE